MAPGSESSGRRNGSIETTSKSQELFLVINFKHQGDLVFSYLEAALQPLLRQGFLTTFDPLISTWHHGVIRVIGTGKTPLTQVIHQSPRYIFYDAPLLSLAGQHLVPATSYGYHAVIRFTPEIAPIASAKLPISYHFGVLLPKWRPLNPFIELLQAYSNGAHRNGIEPRWWGIASQPKFVRKKMWKLLKESGSNWIYTDDLVGATRWLIKWDRKKKKLEELGQNRAKML